MPVTTEHLRARVRFGEQRFASQRFQWQDLPALAELGAAEVEVIPMTSARAFTARRSDEGWEVYDEDGNLIGLADGREIVM